MLYPPEVVEQAGGLELLSGELLGPEEELGAIEAVDGDDRVGQIGFRDPQVGFDQVDRFVSEHFVHRDPLKPAKTVKPFPGAASGRIRLTNGHQFVG